MPAPGLNHDYSEPIVVFQRLVWVSAFDTTLKSEMLKIIPIKVFIAIKIIKTLF